jgi:Icc-related predicted phosphoesterase
VQQLKPRFHVFGHVHEGYGASSDGVTTFINASTCTLKYKPTNAAIVFDVPVAGALGGEGDLGDTT